MGYDARIVIRKYCSGAILIFIRTGLLHTCGFMPNILCESDRIYLRKVRILDVPVIVKWKKDPFVRRMALGSDIKISIKNQKIDVKRALKSKSELYFIIVLKEINKAIGYIRINWFGGAHHFAWLRFALGEERGKGYAKEALRCFLDFLFKKGTHRVDAEVYEFNKVSLCLLKSLGFKKEGLKREAHFAGKRFADVAVLGLLKNDFKKH